MQSYGRSIVLSLGLPGLTKNPGICRPGKSVQRVNVPLAHFLFPLHPDDFVNLHRANLSNSDFGLSRLVGASLFGANLRDTDLFGTVFDFADLSRVKGLNQDQLDNACGKHVRGLPARLEIRPCPGS